MHPPSFYHFQNHKILEKQFEVQKMKKVYYKLGKNRKNNFCQKIDQLILFCNIVS